MMKWQVKRMFDFNLAVHGDSARMVPNSAKADSPPEGEGWEPFAAGIVEGKTVISWTAWRRPIPDDEGST